MEDRKQRSFHSNPTEADPGWISCWYLEAVSIKNGERQKRGTTAPLMIKSSTSKIPRDFIIFMKNGENKTRLVELICQVIK